MIKVIPEDIPSNILVAYPDEASVRQALNDGEDDLLLLNGRTFDLPPGFELPPSILAWGIVFFLLGYAVYASLMAALGALVPNLKEGTQSTIVVIWPTIVPMLLISILIEQPHGALATELSLFPF